MGWPEPSKALAETPFALARSRRVIVPVTGSITVGGPPQLAGSDRSVFQVMPVFSTRDPVTSSIRSASEIGLASSEQRMIAQKVFETSAERLLTLLPLALTKPTSACERGLSMVTKPWSAELVYQANWPVSLW